MILVWCLGDPEGNRLKDTKWPFERAQWHKMLGESVILVVKERAVVPMYECGGFRNCLGCEQSGSCCSQDRVPLAYCIGTGGFLASRQISEKGHK